MMSPQLEGKHLQNQHDSRHSVLRTEPLQIESMDIKMEILANRR